MHNKHNLVKYCVPPLIGGSTLPSQKYGNSGKNPIKYSGKVPSAKCLKSDDADERI